ncbi:MULTISPECIES: Sec-independent protein translocase protein TatB [Nitrospirillum]|uniref:Sec-independent protein translocase protein TatB n=1 Tax=Nitrospirillum amazonense TaxID=28077 RepID=A0A560GDA2_9PROT|nr:Sec-independent protein translocase protein TatB [Nitrospirillum amazonense]MEC4594889.1 Sec-independent protein translocase protein TatB [Nitrospirillum amazonense]TWB31724.1 sec-independent protein translocase protein TatB [Nitrospirillum amazonense]
MFDIAWSELALIGVVALVVIGPKDLPVALYTAGKWMRKARLLARDFQSHLDDMVRQAELEDLRKQAQKVAQFDLTAEVTKMVDPTDSVRQALEINPTASLTATEVTPAPTAAPEGASEGSPEGTIETQPKVEPAEAELPAIGSPAMPLILPESTPEAAAEPVPVAPVAAPAPHAEHAGADAPALTKS